MAKVLVTIKSQGFSVEPECGEIIPILPIGIADFLAEIAQHKEILDGLTKHIHLGIAGKGFVKLLPLGKDQSQPLLSIGFPGLVLQGTIERVRGGKDCLGAIKVVCVLIGLLLFP